MARSPTVALALAVILSGCHRGASLPETSPEAEQLRWLDQADVVADFTERVERQHDLRFLSVYAFTTPTAFGLDESPEVPQLIQRHGDRHIEGTTDIITSAEHRRLLAKASDYVKQYNTLLLHFLREHPNI